jgi:hypothetical protein
LASQIWCRSIFRLMAIVGSRRRSGIWSFSMLIFYVWKIGKNTHIHEGCHSYFMVHTYMWRTRFRLFNLFIFIWFRLLFYLY